MSTHSTNDWSNNYKPDDWMWYEDPYPKRATSDQMAFENQFDTTRFKNAQSRLKARFRELRLSL